MNGLLAGPSADGPEVLVDDRTASRDPEGVAGGGTGSRPDADSLGELLAAVLRSEGATPGSEAGLHLVGAAEMASLNSRATGSGTPTDVLSFPVDAPGGGGEVPLLVGDVVLCPEIAEHNAASHAGTFVDECRLLVVHGGLHLCGWDHSTPHQRREMWQRERELMAALGISPSRDPWGAP